MKKAVIFDLDGTLWNSAKEVITSWNEMIETFEDKDHFVTLEEMYGLMGKPMDEIGDLVFPNVSKERRLELMRICTKYENEYLREHGGTLFPKVEETLKELSKEYSLYIVSNCQVGYIEAFLGYYGFEHYFEDTECYGNTGKMKGYNIKLLHDRNNIDFALLQWYNFSIMVVKAGNSVLMQFPHQIIVRFYK